MIPLSSKEFVEHKDKDGMVWRFKPKTGTLENKQYSIWEEGISIKELYDRQNNLIKEILISPIEEYEKADYNNEEKSKILGIWNLANRLAIEEKKS